MTKRKSTRCDYEVKDLEDVELPSAQKLIVDEKTLQADADLEASLVNFRWQKAPLSLVKAVAESMGVPYQAYIKQVVYRQAMKDLAMFQQHCRR